MWISPCEINMKQKDLGAKGAFLAHMEVQFEEKK